VEQNGSCAGAQGSMKKKGVPHWVSDVIQGRRGGWKNVVCQSHKLEGTKRTITNRSVRGHQRKGVGSNMGRKQGIKGDQNLWWVPF